MYINNKPSKSKSKKMTELKEEINVSKIIGGILNTSSVADIIKHTQKKDIED